MSTIQVMCRFGNQDCLDKIKEKYNDWLVKDQPLNDFKNVVLQNVMRYASEAEWKTLYNKALTTSDNPEKLRFLKGLAKTQNLNLLKL
jgi:hypothetical protein